MVTLEKYSLGVGDRFGRQAKAQLRACMAAANEGVEIVPVWNKSHREHLIIGSQPSATRAAANEAAKTLGWTKSFYVDADHIRVETVDRFLPHADFFTIDVADAIGQRASDNSIQEFVHRHSNMASSFEIMGLRDRVKITAPDLERIARKYLSALQEAGRIYRHIRQLRNDENFITEVSMDETSSPQSPHELLVILAGLADENVPMQTIAPKFTGRFNKGVDFEGDIARFGNEFQDDLAVIAFAIQQFALPANLKLSVHSGSDKFSLYPVMQRAMKRFDSGIHLKTAGTTWLEELIGLAEAGGRGLKIAKRIYSGALEHVDDLCAPYASVIDIDRGHLPSAELVNGWSGEQFVFALRHDKLNPAYNPHLRQLLHVGYKIAAKLGDEFLDALGEFEGTVGQNVTLNLLERHIRPLYFQTAQNA